MIAAKKQVYCQRNLSSRRDRHAKPANKRVYQADESSRDLLRQNSAS